jgi:hypothetical protein
MHCELMPGAYKGAPYLRPSLLRDSEPTHVPAATIPTEDDGAGTLNLAKAHAERQMTAREVLAAIQQVSSVLGRDGSSLDSEVGVGPGTGAGTASGTGPGPGADASSIGNGIVLPSTVVSVRYTNVWLHRSWVVKKAPFWYT